MKKTIIWLVVIVLVIVGIYFIATNFSYNGTAKNTETSTSTTPVATSTSTVVAPKNLNQTVIGQSVEGRDIVAYHYGIGSKELLFVGGIHGGYEWNTALVAYQLMDYLKANPTVIPANIKVTVIPVLNPDGLNKVIGTSSEFKAADVTASLSSSIPGRFNANKVDLNRNFDCNWQASGVWQNTTVSGGTSAFSEPESLAMKNYVENNNPAAVVIWYSSAGGVYSSSCNNGVSSETKAITNVYAKASGYPAHESFDVYATTGDMANWLADNNIPAISVLLTDHTSTEWIKNQAGVNALLKYYTK